MSKSFVQVPPQSTGKKLLTEYRKELYFDNQIDNMFIGDVITGETSGATGKISGIITEGFSSNTGELYLKEFTGTFLDNENIQISGLNVATVNLLAGPQQEFDLQKIVISDANNPEFNQRIDRFGATVNTFTDGSPIFGPFGTLTVGEPQIIKFYRFANDNVDVLWHNNTSGGGTITWEGQKTACLMSTGTANGDIAQRTTNYYHPYIPGVGHLVEFTMQSGDLGKANLRRRWGYFDDENGAFFELEGTTLYVVLRSNVSGTIVDTRISQNQWNINQADGSDNINFSLDVTKANMYWIDLQWHGAGRVRFGVYEPEGTRIPLHVFKFANSTDLYPYMRTAALPLRFEQVNTGTTISTSQMRFTSAVVKHTSHALINGDKFAHRSQVISISDTDGEVPIVSFRPKTTYNGYANRGQFKGLSFETVNLGSVPVLWRLRFAPYGGSLANSNFTSKGTNSITELDVSANSVITAATVSLLKTFTLPNSVNTIYDRDGRELHTFEINLGADGITQPIVTLTAQAIKTGNTEVVAAVNWEEYKL